RFAISGTAIRPTSSASRSSSVRASSSSSSSSSCAHASGRSATSPASSRRSSRRSGSVGARSFDASERRDQMTGKRRPTTEEAKRVGDEIGVDWTRFDLEQFRSGMDVEFEHGSHDPQTDVTGDDPIVTGKIALAHMKEFPDYYERLERMESEAERAWSEKS